MRIHFLTVLLSVLVISTSLAQDENIDLEKQKTLYLVSNAHFDTQWNWTVQTSINNFVYNTLKENIYLLEKYPDYVFNFEGAIKYMWMKEYYPYEYEKVKQFIAQGRWNVAGGSIDANEVQVSSSESQFRNILLGQNYFKSEFGKKSNDIFLPDCFGFGYTLPTIAAHAGMKGFSTQKLSKKWGAAFPNPFEIGVWQGVDGSSIYAALKPGPYIVGFESDIATDTAQLNSINRMGDETGLYVNYRYYGTGDRGGAPDENSVSYIANTIRDTSKMHVIMSSSGALWDKFTAEDKEKLKVYDGELPLTMHGAGCYTSQAFLKYINRKNELLADAAERAAVAADWLQGVAYPREKLNEAWVRFLWHQFHDDLTGTSIPEVYSYTWNDEFISYQQFGSVYSNSTATVIQAMDTDTEGVPVVVNNALSTERNEPVEAVITLTDDTKAVRVFNKSGKEVPSQVNMKEGDNYTVLFLASVPANGFEVYNVKASNEPCKLKTKLKITEGNLENEKYKVSVDANGDIASVYDKSAKKELFTSPARLEMLNDETPNKPAWRIYYNVVSAEPRNYVGNVKSVEIAEEGPVRVSLKVMRETEGSTFVQYIQLSAGDAAERVDVVNDIDWNSRNTLLKAAFPFTVSNEQATYDLGVGTISRGNNKENLYEVPAQQWADITDEDGKYGVSILNDGKYGWDKPADNILRLTLLHTPMTKRNTYYQTYQDLGKHHFTYSISGHKKSWKNTSNLWQATCLNQPLIAFQTEAHDGELGKSFSLASVNTKQVAIKAIKKAENGDAVVIRLQELLGENANNVAISFASPIVSAKELNAIEEEIGEATIKDGKLMVNMTSYQPKTFSLVLSDAKTKIEKIEYKHVELDYNWKVSSGDNDRLTGEFDYAGNSIPAELLPDSIVSDGVAFKIRKGTNIGWIVEVKRNSKDAVIPNGQTVKLPEGDYNRVYILAAATEDTEGTFSVGDNSVTLGIQYYSGFIGQWNSLKFNRVMNEELYEKDFKIVGETPAYLKEDNIAWVGTHRHRADGTNEAYTFCYLYKYAIDIPKGSTTLKLPDNDKIRIMAVTVANDKNKNTNRVSPEVIKL